MFRFGHIEYLWWLLGLVVIALLFISHIIWTKKTVRKISNSTYRDLVIPGLSLSSKWIRFFFFFMGWLTLIIGLANPQIGSKLFEAKHEGIDLVLAIDVSNSMLAEDIRPNRLERTRLGIEKLIDKLEGDRLGIVIFAGKAFVQLPLTTDYAAAKLFTRNLNTNSVSEQGTSIGTALDVSLQSFDFESPTSKVVIVVTDGEDHEEDAIKMAQTAKSKEVKVFTVGMGSVQGAPIPIYKNGNQLGYRKDKNGKTIVTKLNENMLQEIADAGGGKFFRASNGNIGLQSILDEINSLEKTELESKIYSDYEDRFQYFLIGALLLFLLEVFWPQKRIKFIENLNLFGNK